MDGQPGHNNPHGSLYPTWRDTVEHRLGSAHTGLTQNGRELEELRTDFRALSGKLDLVTTTISETKQALSDQLSAGLAGLRTDVLTARAQAPAPSASVDWKIVALTGALVAGGLVGVGIAVGKAWETDDTRGMVRDVVTP